MSIPYTLANGPGNLPDATQLNANFAAGILKDGSATPTANLPMGSHKLTGLANGTATGDSVTWDQLSGIIAASNILINGGFDVWQRGTTFAVGAGGGAYQPDRWTWPGMTGASAATISQEATNVHDGGYSMKINITALGTATSFYMNQIVENFADYSGKTVTFSAWIKTTMSNVIITMNNGTIQSSAHPGDGAWHQLSVTTTFGTLTFLNAFCCAVFTGLTTGIVYVDSCMLVLGPTPAPWCPRPVAQELALCQRYYETTSLNGAIGAAFGTQRSTTVVDFIWPFKVSKRVAPTIAFSSITLLVPGSGGGKTITSPTTNSVNSHGSEMFGTITAVGAVGTFCFIDGGSITADAEM